MDLNTNYSDLIYDLAVANKHVIPKKESDDVYLESAIDAIADYFDLFAKFQAMHCGYSDIYVHSINVARCAIALGKELSDKIRTLAIASLLHDIGKMCISKDILYKPSKLDEAELRQMNLHPEFGYHIVKGFIFDKDIINIVLCHHVHLDKSGYPEDMLKYPISLENRIVTASDMYVALREKRSYKNGVSHAEAINILRGSMNAQVDQKIVDLIDSKYKEAE